MPVQASDIVQTMMDRGVEPSTGCEQAALTSDEYVRKEDGATSVSWLSNQIHIAKPGFKRKPWKSERLLDICPIETDR